MWRDDILSQTIPVEFKYVNIVSDDIFERWEKEIFETVYKTKIVTETKYYENKKNGGFAVTVKLKKYISYPAFDIKFIFENNGSEKSDIVENVNSLKLPLTALTFEEHPFYHVHKAYGGHSSATDFVRTDLYIHQNCECVMSAASGRSSNGDFPFFKVDEMRGSIIKGNEGSRMGRTL